MIILIIGMRQGQGSSFWIKGWVLYPQALYSWKKYICGSMLSKSLLIKTGCANVWSLVSVANIIKNDLSLRMYIKAH